ncbi:MAG TPA: VWA domain-containing protein [Thermoanaerobaculia bacterium]|jgi:VWFA-related protein|nr:VWA domain-containing protein [Thermoanaerobaculia bacterium]
MRHVLVFVATSLIAIAALAQSGAAIDAHPVAFPVTVVNASGSPVRGLTAANFVLYDEKKKQPITSVDVADFASDSQTNAQANAIVPMNPAARRSYVLLFDLGFTSSRSLPRAQDAARRFVNEIAGPRDLIAIATVHPDRGFRFVTAFTTDRNLVASAIGNPASFRGSDPLRLGSEPIGPEPEAQNSAQQASPPTGGANEPQSRERIEREIDSISKLARSLRMMPGRKQMVLLSEGFDSHLLQSGDTHNAREQVIDRMTDDFRVSDVVLHAIDVQDSLAPVSRINANAGLFLLARPTGGEVVPSGELHDDFARLLRQQEVVYVLGFHVSDFAPGTFHNVNVRLVNVPEGARVVQGAGYFERGRDTPVERSLTNAQIIVNDAPQHDLRINLLAAPFPPTAAGKPAQVPVVIDINGADLIRETSTTIGGADVFIYAFDMNGVVRDRLYDCLTVEVAKAGEKVRKTGIRYYGTLMLPPGRYAVKALIRTGDPDRGAAEAAEKRGYARVNITVPAAGQIAILPLIPIDEDGKWLLVRGLRRENVDYPFEYGGRTFSPTATLDTSGGSRKVALFIFGAQRADLTFETRPQTKVLGVTEGNGVTKVVLQIDHAFGASALDVTVFKKGIAAGQRTSVPLM